jgi:methylthioribose-1-phosphate isomerase
MAITGADRIAVNGDTANKIGTYMHAVCAAYHTIPFYIAAPASTFDLSLASGAEIPIEERAADEVRCFGKILTALSDSRVYNPAFDVTPAELIAGFMTDCGLVRPPYAASFQKLRGKDRSAK